MVKFIPYKNRYISSPGFHSEMILFSNHVDVYHKEDFIRWEALSQLESGPISNKMDLEAIKCITFIQYISLSIDTGQTMN